jgi:hypothetical protein
MKKGKGKEYEIKGRKVKGRAMETLMVSTPRRPSIGQIA